MSAFYVNLIAFFYKEYGLNWENTLEFILTVSEMSGKNTGHQAKIKTAAPEGTWNHYMLHNEVLSSKELSSALRVILQPANYIKTQTLKSHMFKILL